MLRRVADKLNPFSSSDGGKKEEPKTDGTMEALAKRNQAQKNGESNGLLASLWPFGSKEPKPSTATTDAQASGLVSQIDESLKQKGIDSTARQSAFQPPPADLPKTDDLAKGPPPATDTAALLSAIDGNLKKSGKSGAELPPPPEAAEAFKDAAAIQERVAKASPAQSPAASKDVQSSGILSSIDQKLRNKGVEPAKFEQPPTAEEVKASTPQKPQPKNLELEPKVTLEKGPLYLNSSDLAAPEKAAASTPVPNRTAENDSTVKEPPSRVLVKGPIQQQAAAKPAEAKKPSLSQDDEPKGALDQLRQDVENASKVLNPFRW